MLGSTDLEVSTLGFGAATLGNEYGATERSIGAAAVRHAVERGLNFFDVSPYYGRKLAEERLGEALVGIRDRVVLATKCGRHDVNRFDFSAAGLRASVEDSLRRLRTDRVELLQLHDVEFADARQILEEALPTLDALRREGKCLAIGITGYPLGHLARLLRASPVRLDTVLSYARYTLLCDDLLAVLAPVAAERAVALLGASPLHMRVLTPLGPPPWHKAAPAVIEAGRRIVEHCAARGLSAPRVALRFCLDAPAITSTFVGLSSPAEVDENLAAFDLANDSSFLAELRALAAEGHGRPWLEGRPENNP